MELREAFDAADIDKGGSLALDEFVEAFGTVIGKDMNKKQINQLFMKIDADSNGDVDWDEFMNYMLLENETLSQMNAEHFEYVKTDIEDPPPTKGKPCHMDMITCILVVEPELEQNVRGQKRSTSQDDELINSYTKNKKKDKFHLNEEEKEKEKKDLEEIKKKL